MPAQYSIVLIVIKLAKHNVIGPIRITHKRSNIFRNIRILFKTIVSTPNMLEKSLNLCEKVTGDLVKQKLF